VIAKPIESIDEVDLLQLIEAGTPEGKRIEYKRDLPESSEQGKVKFLKSVTALANTQGGDLIYGMDAKDGIPQRISALAMSSADQVLQRLESLCADGVSPRLAGVQYRFVPLIGDGEVLVVRVAKSWNAPHRVTAGGHSHFYGRNAAGTYPLDVGELRQAFTLSESVAERIRIFRANRLLAFGNGEALVPLVQGARVVLHVIPLQSLTSEFRVDLSSRAQQQVQVLQRVAPPGANGWSQRLNLDGRLTYNHEGDGMASAYALLFRSGIVEAAQVWSEWNDEKILPSLAYERDIINALRAYLAALLELGLVPPAYIFLSLLGVAGHRFAVDNWRSMDRNHYADRDALILPEMLIENWSVDPAETMRPLFDMVWNAFGYERSFNYDEDGRWSGR
jgi:hypothetical protein